MTEKRYLLAEKLRTYISKYGINDFNEEHLKTVGVTLEELKETFSDRRDIVKAILNTSEIALQRYLKNTISTAGMQ